jgi:hypothetical protein
MPWRHMGEWRYSSTILDLGTRWRWAISFTPRMLYPRGNCPRYPLDRRLSGPQSRSGRCGEERNLPPVVSRTPAVQPVARHHADWAILTSKLSKSSLINNTYVLHQIRRYFNILKSYFTIFVWAYMSFWFLDVFKGTCHNNLQPKGSISQRIFSSTVNIYIWEMYIMVYWFLDHSGKLFQLQWSNEELKPEFI